MVNKIPKTSISQIEQETVIVVNPATKRASVYSCIPSMVKKLYRYAEHEDVKIDMDNEYGLTIDVPQNWVKVKPPIKRVLSEEQKIASAERLAKMRAKK